MTYAKRIPRTGKLWCEVVKTRCCGEHQPVGITGHYFIICNECGKHCDIGEDTRAVAFDVDFEYEYEESAE